ncbi:phosphate ABC transporter substrate-binding protein PstS [Terriglobus sp.]|uniref:phosphate ABC transporter substrate-binding protein PstS n=1 Tax=Terriglobus sp. TaxID=1889013 RepID=UPI003B00A9F1
MMELRSVCRHLALLGGASLLLCGGLAGCRRAGSQASPGVINGAGASFPYPIYSEWFALYDREHPGVEINYQPIGSGGGIRQVRDGILDFGGTDGPMTDAQMAASPVKVLHVPTVLGAVVPVYHLPGVRGELNFSAGVIADIYLGTITRWNDPRIVKENPGVALPDHEILPVYRSDGSGTTFVWTDFLSKCSTTWASRVGRATSVEWPIGIGEKGSEGVSGMVEQSPYSFGYVEMNYAAQNGMTYGRIQNLAGHWVKATPESVTAAAQAMVGAIPADFRASLTNPPGAESYPVTSLTWLLVPIRPKDPRHGPVIADFLHWMLTTGESLAPGMHYAPLPPELQARVLASLRQLQR